ncbi:MAG: hypothetical protein ABI589_04645 [Burkholderiales bacterium]
MKTVLCAMLVIPLCCLAESRVSSGNASARLNFRVTIPPVFRVLQSTPVEGGIDHRVWTNMKSIVINGTDYRFARVGEARLHLPASPRGDFIIHGL